MKNLLTLIGVSLALVACSAPSDTALTRGQTESAAHTTTEGDDRNPVVVELFQSQGCSSCPPASANVNALAERGDILALSFAVTYWDQLGWKDTFANPAFTQRQRDYARKVTTFQVATPQIVINGNRGLIGNKEQQLNNAIAQSGPVTGGPLIDIAKGKLVIGAGRAAQPAVIWLVRYDPRDQEVAISAGENNGRTLPHRNIVREFSNLGEWSGQEVMLPVNAVTDPAYKTAVLLQSGVGGPIIAARKF